MSNGIKMTEDQFEELALESKLTALFRKAVENGTVLEEIRETCRCREESCGKMFADLGRKVKAKTIIEKAIATGAGTISGFLAGLFGGHMR